jgi:hypothetical protein
MAAAAGFAFQTIERAAIGTKRIAARLDGQIDARVSIPVRVLRHWTVQWQVIFSDLNDALGIYAFMPFRVLLGIVVPFAHAESVI